MAKLITRKHLKVCFRLTLVLKRPQYDVGIFTTVESSLGVTTQYLQICLLKKFVYCVSANPSIKLHLWTRYH